MVYLNSKKTQITKVFVYISSIIIIVFCAFLVGKFILTFSHDTKEVVQTKFFNEIEKNYDMAKKSWGSQYTFDYKVPSKVRYVCFLNTQSCVDSGVNLNSSYLNNLVQSSSIVEDTKMIYSTGNNIIIYDREGLLTSKKLQEIYIDECFCVEPSTHGNFKLEVENRRNKVYISKVD